MHFPVATPNLSYSAACVSASKLQICHCHLCHDQFPFPSRCWTWWATRWCWGNPSSCGATATEARCPSSTPCSAPTGTLPGRRWRRPRSEPSLTSRPSTRRRASKTSCAAQITASAGWTKRGKCYAPPLSVRHMQQPGHHIGKKKKKSQDPGRMSDFYFVLFLDLQSPCWSRRCTFAQWWATSQRGRKLFWCAPSREAHFLSASPGTAPRRPAPSTPWPSTNWRRLTRSPKSGGTTRGGTTAWATTQPMKLNRVPLSLLQVGVF